MGEVFSRAWRRRKLRQSVNWLLGFHGSPRQIARGLAIGVIIAFSPTMGFQMAIAAVLATLTYSSRAAAIAAVWITNPLTALPIYTFTYRIGGWFGPTLGISDFRRRLSTVLVNDAGEWLDLQQQVLEITRLGREVLWPLTLGGAIVGIAAGAVSYLIALGMIEFGRRTRRTRGTSRPAGAASARPARFGRSSRQAVRNT